MAKQYTYEPDYAVPPGITLKETLEMKGLSQADLALRTGLAEKTISQIINGVAPITYETADKLELVLDIPARFWNRRELDYRETLARIEATERLESDLAWLKGIPVAVLKEREYVDEAAEGPGLVRLVLKFFGVSSIDAWQKTWDTPAVQYRGKEAQERRPGYVAAWLRMGELQAESSSAELFDATGFKRVLEQARRLTVLPVHEWKDRVTALCAEVGVVLVFTKEIAGAGVSGATRWLTKDRALIQVSLKYKTDDQLFFTFFHEAGHILLHSKKRVFVDFGLSDATTEEKEANEFARDTLIPPGVAHRLPYLRNRQQIRAFAESLGIASGIVVGRLQHDDLVFKSAFTDLKRKLTWS